MSPNCPPLHSLKQNIRIEVQYIFFYKLFISVLKSGKCVMCSLLNILIFFRIFNIIINICKKTHSVGVSFQ